VHREGPFQQTQRCRLVDALALLPDDVSVTVFEFQEEGLRARLIAAMQT